MEEHLTWKILMTIKLEQDQVGFIQYHSELGTASFSVILVILCFPENVFTECIFPEKSGGYVRLANTCLW